MAAAIDALCPDQINSEVPDQAKLKLKVVEQDPREDVAIVGLT